MRRVLNVAQHWILAGWISPILSLSILVVVIVVHLIPSLTSSDLEESSMLVIVVDGKGLWDLVSRLPDYQFMNQSQICGFV